MKLKTFFKAGIAAAYLLSTNFALATNQTAGGAAQNLTDNAISFWGLLLVAFALLGLYACGTGLAKVKNSTPQQNTATAGWISFAIGLLLISLTALIVLSSNTFYGDDQATEGFDRFSAGSTGS